MPVEPCRNHNNDVFASVSKDHGRTWTSARKVSGGGTSAQWQPWGDVGENGNLYVGYYDRKYGACETSGCNDITLATSGDNGRSWSHRRITTSSMPNLTCGVNSFECGFLGDYMSTVFWKGKVHMVWADTRGRGLGFPEEDIYYAKVGG
jgi:Neuraminidase (sialidase)